MICTSLHTVLDTALVKDNLIKRNDKWKSTNYGLSLMVLPLNEVLNMKSGDL